jgi:hypothetical protein
MPWNPADIGTLLNEYIKIYRTVIVLVILHDTCNYIIKHYALKAYEGVDV